MKIFKKKDDATPWIVVITLIGIFVLSSRTLIYADKFHTGLLYIGIPYALSLALYYFTPYKKAETWTRRFWNNLRTFIIILLASSLILMEGYICLIMALPLFFAIVLFAFTTTYIWNRFGKNSPKSYILPAIMVVASLEGTTPALTFDRYNEVSYSQIVDIDVETIRQKIQNPIEFSGDRHWILSIFPMPTYISTTQLNEGSVRKYDFVYHRWFVTNTKAGSVNVLFKEVGNNIIKTKITDSSYISGYMNLHGTQFTFDPISENQTRVTLTVSFDRTLDPIWYYQPLERFAVKKGVKYFINEVLTAERKVEI